MTEGKLRIGIVGVGFGTTVHVPGFVSEGAEVVAICSRTKERVENAARELDIPNVFTDYRDMLKMDDLDAVTVVTPPSSHHEISMAALDAGKHVLCEKPFAMDQIQGEQMLAKAEATGLTAMIAHEFRFAPGRAYVKELLGQGYVGDLRMIHVTLFRGGTTQPQTRSLAWGSDAAQGGGFLGALGSHYIDCLRDWVGEVKSVCGATFAHDTERVDTNSGQTVATDADDAFSFILRFENGAWASMSANSVAPFGPGALIQIYGSEGVLQTPQPGFNPPPDGKVFGARFGDSASIDELEMPSYFRPFEDSRDERLMAFRIMVRRFMTGIAEGTSPSPNFYDGYRCQQILDAIHASMSGVGWVELRNN